MTPPPPLDHKKGWRLVYARVYISYLNARPGERGDSGTVMRNHVICSWSEEQQKSSVPQAVTEEAIRLPTQQRIRTLPLDWDKQICTLLQFLVQHDLLKHSIIITSNFKLNIAFSKSRLWCSIVLLHFDLTMEQFSNVTCKTNAVNTLVSNKRKTLHNDIINKSELKTNQKHLAGAIKAQKIKHKK